MIRSESRLWVSVSILMLALTLSTGSAAASVSLGGAVLPQPDRPGAIEATTVRIEPSIKTVTVGDVFDMAFVVMGAENLGGYWFEMSYNPAIVEVLDVADSGFLEENSDRVGWRVEGPQILSETVKFGYWTLPEGLDPAPGASGSGTLAVIQLEAKAVGVGGLDLDQVKLYRTDEDFPQAPDATLNAMVDVVACQEVQVTELTLTPDPVQAGQPLTLTATLTGDDPITSTWSFGDGAPPQTGVGLDQVTHTYTASGPYTVTLDVENCSSQGMDTVQQAVTVEERPCQAVSIDTLSVSPSPPLAGQELAFHAPLTGDPPITTTWEFGDGTAPETAAGLVQVTHLYEEAGVYTVTLTAENCSNDGPYTDVATRTLTVGEPCDLAIVDLYSDSPAALGDTIRFTAAVTGSQPITYTWDFGDGSPLDVGVGMDVVTYTYAATGTYQVNLTVENHCGQDHAEVTALVLEDPLVVSIQPPSSVAFPGQVFTVAVTVQRAEDLGGYNLLMAYDPAVVDVLHVQDGGFIGQEGRQVLPVGPSYPTTATVEFSAASFPPPEGGVDGDGFLAVLTLEAVGDGISPLDLLDDTVSLLLTTSDDPVAPTIIRDGTLTVGGYNVFLPVILRGYGP